VNRSLLSGRSQQRLIELQRAANVTLQELNQHHSLLIGALLGCDNATQRTMLDEHRALVASAVDSLLKLNAFLNHCRVAPEAASADQR
jgi:hypothetical protein